MNTQEVSRTDDWYQIVIRDESLLSGTSVRLFLELLITALRVEYVLAADMVGSFSGLQHLSGKPLRAREFLQRAGEATQYDWAFFFLFRSMPDPLADGIDYRTVIAIADATVRLVDDEFFYVYSKDQQVLNCTRQHFQVEECGLHPLKALDVPS